MDRTVHRVFSTNTLLAGGDKEVMSRTLTWLQGRFSGHPFDGLEELGHVDVPPEVVPLGRGDVLDGLFPTDNILRIKVERRFIGDQLEGYRLCTSGLVGIAAVGDPDSGLPFATVTVKPKVPGASLLTMLSYAFVPELASEQRAQIDVKDAPIVSLVVLMYLLRLEQMIREHGLQRAYMGLEEELRGTVRGRCVLAAYLGRNVPAGKAHIVPCKFWELRIDSEPNRALRWGVEVCRTLAGWLSPSGLVEQVEKLWGGLAPHFSEVPVISYQSSQVRRLPRSGRFAPYESVFELLEFLLDNLSLDIVSGQVHVRGFAVEMWKVFERFVVNVLASRMRGQIKGPQVEFRYEVKGQEGILDNKAIYLDALVRGRRKLVLDAKWKEGIVSRADPNDQNSDMLHIEGLHIRNADLFQVVAYGKHKEVQAQGSVLVYPVLEPAAVCRHRCILGFVDNREGTRPFPVFLIGMPVGDTLDHSIGDFVEKIREISEGPTEIENSVALAWGD